MMKVSIPLVVGFCEVFRRNTKKVTKERERERKREREEKKLVKKRRGEKDIKYNEKNTFNPLFKGKKGETGNDSLIEVTSEG